MSPFDKQTVLDRIDRLLATDLPAGNAHGIYAAVVDAFQGTMTLVAAIYGNNSPQAQTLLKAAETARQKDKTIISHNFHTHVWHATQGTLKAMRADVEAGLVGDIQRRTAGEVVADMIGLAKEALAEGSDGAKNVAAVLAAAAYEDTLRRMGAAFANVQGRPPLADVVMALKNAKVIEGAAVGIVQSHLKFRNDALHADWAKVTDTAVNSCTNLVEQLLLKRFS